MNLLSIIGSVLLSGEGSVATDSDAVTLLSAAASNADATLQTEPLVSSTDPAGCLSSCGGGSMLTMLLIYAVIIGGMYLLFIRPQNKRRQQEEEMRKSVEIGDEITTIGGICGRVVSIKEDDTLVIETGSDRNKMKIKNWAISSNETAKSRVDDTPKEEKKGFFAKLFGKN